MNKYAQHWKQLNRRDHALPRTLDIALCAVFITIEAGAIALAILAVTGIYA